MAAKDEAGRVMVVNLEILMDGEWGEVFERFADFFFAVMENFFIWIYKELGVIFDQRLLIWYAVSKKNRLNI